MTGPGRNLPSRCSIGKLVKPIRIETIAVPFTPTAESCPPFNGSVARQVAIQSVRDGLEDMREHLEQVFMKTSYLIFTVATAPRSLGNLAELK